MRVLMKSRLLLMALIGGGAVLAGCGGGGGGTLPGEPASRRGAVAFTIEWPQPTTRLIPVAAQSIRVILTTAGGQTLADVIIPRPPAGQNTTTATVSEITAGDVIVIATARPNPDGTGVAQARGVIPLTILADQTVDTSLTMQSTIRRLELTPPGATFDVGAVVTFGVTARDADDAVVLIAPGNLQWQSSAPGNASVDQGGNATGVSPGIASITVQESESGLSASAPVLITPGQGGIDVGIN